MSTNIFDCQYDNTNLTNSAVFQRESTVNDLGCLILSKETYLEDEIYLGIDANDYELVCLIGELGWYDVFVDNDGNQL